MKKILIYDIIFIVVSAIVLIGVNYFSDPQFMGKYSLLVAMVSYFIGKAVQKIESKKRSEE